MCEKSQRTATNSYHFDPDIKDDDFPGYSGNGLQPVIITWKNFFQADSKN